MEKEFKSGNPTEAFAIAGDIKQNLQKINQHGKRADAIVKGMLQHSLVTTGQKELTDLNALSSEYIRLSFHAMKAKDNSFQCEIRENLDPTIAKINLNQQDLGRVLQNIINNAFYSLKEKKKILGGGFAPLLSISTHKVDHQVKLYIRDNGIGISQKNIEKIFQPFFTTKPTGQGTGLGLSLAYDIIVKEHGGNIQVESVEGEYAEFIIILPDMEIS
jgi:signal transduction histidine kinase